MANPNRSRKQELISRFLDKPGTRYPIPTATFTPRTNTRGCEDFTNVLLSHAQLYVLGDKHDIPSLRQLTLHRLHATLKGFTIYPGRFDDIAALARYVLGNTVPWDKMREMVTVYYACIVEDASKHEGLKSVIDEFPDFAFDLVMTMSERVDYACGSGTGAHR